MALGIFRLLQAVTACYSLLQDPPFRLYLRPIPRHQGPSDVIRGPKIFPTTRLRIGNDRTKGYALADFAEPFALFLDSQSRIPDRSRS